MKRIVLCTFLLGLVFIAASCTKELVNIDNQIVSIDPADTSAKEDVYYPAVIAVH